LVRAAGFFALRLPVTLCGELSAWAREITTSCVYRIARQQYLLRAPARADVQTNIYIQC
jgi:hypothetical protein